MHASLFHCVPCENVPVPHGPVSVIDVLPTRVASVYTFYNPDYRYMEWGKYTALREIFWTQQVSYEPAVSALAPATSHLSYLPSTSIHERRTVLLFEKGEGERVGVPCICFDIYRVQCPPPPTPPLPSRFLPYPVSYELFPLILRSHSMSFIGAQGIPMFKMGFLVLPPDDHYPIFCHRR